MIVKYFSWIREHVGKSEEEIELPHNIKTIDDLIKYLANLNDNYKSAFANKEIIKIAVNKSYSDITTQIFNEDEIAFFPPVTGG